MEGIVENYIEQSLEWYSNLKFQNKIIIITYYFTLKLLYFKTKRRVGFKRYFIEH